MEDIIEFRFTEPENPLGCLNQDGEDTCCYNDAFLRPLKQTGAQKAEWDKEEDVLQDLDQDGKVSGDGGLVGPEWKINVPDECSDSHQECDPQKCGKIDAEGR